MRGREASHLLRMASLRILSIHDDCRAPGGSNLYRTQLRDLLRNRGVEVFLFTHAVDECDDERPFFCYRKKVSNLKFLRHVESCYVKPSLVISLRRWIAKVKPDLIHIHHCYIFPTSVLLGCMGQAPIVMTVHDFTILCRVESARDTKGEFCTRCQGTICSRIGYPKLLRPLLFPLKELAPKRFLKILLRETVDCFIAPSKAMEEELKRLRFRTFFLPHFVDSSRFSETRLDQDHHNVLFVGLLESIKGVDIKGVDILIHAFSRVVRTVPDATLMIVGNGPQETMLKELCARLNLEDHVKFHGWVSHTRIHDFYAQADVIVVPSTVMENSPLTIYEAMACGRPVIGSRLGGIPGLVSDGENGLLFEPGDYEDLAKKIVELLNDKTKAATMGEVGRQWARSLYSREQHVDRYLELAGDLVSH